MPQTPQHAKPHQPRATPCPAKDGRTWRVLVGSFESSTVRCTRLQARVGLALLAIGIYVVSGFFRFDWGRWLSKEERDNPTSEEKH